MENVPLKVLLIVDALSEIPQLMGYLYPPHHALSRRWELCGAGS